MSEKCRLDQLVFERGLAPSREKARALILAGQVLIDDRPVTKPGTAVKLDAVPRLKNKAQPYVSRGGEKLAGAFAEFDINPKDQQWLDIGQSTGGFTDFLLQHGTAHVTGVDVGYGQLDWRLRKDPRVTCIERTNARSLTAKSVNHQQFHGAVIDVSFISLELILPAVAPLIGPGGQIVALVKPQFEVGKGQVGKGGVVRDPKLIQTCVDKISLFSVQLGLAFRGQAPSPIRGPKGNQEIFIRLIKE